MCRSPAKVQITEIVDISSGVEKEKGVKCTAKIKKIIKYVKESNF